MANVTRSVTVTAPADAAASRATARLVGVLFIVATVASIVGGSMVTAWLDDPDYLAEVAAHEGQLVLGVLLELILAFSVIGIAALLLPVLRPHDEGLAVGYVAVRTVEAGFILAASTGALLVLALSQDFGSAGAVGAEAVGSTLLSAREWTYLIGTVLVFGVSAVILNAVLLRSRLVDGWLSLWGLVGGVLLLCMGVAELFGVAAAFPLQLLAAPIGLQEMALAVVLIWKGFATVPVEAAPGEPGLGAGSA